MPTPLKRGQPCFFHCGDLVRGDGGSPPGDGPSSPSWSAGTVSALPGGPFVSPGGGTPRNSKPGLSSTAGIRKNSPRTSGNEPRPEAKRPPTLQTVRSRDKKVSELSELPIFCGALLQGPKLPLRAFPLLILSIVRRINKNPSARRRAKGGFRMVSSSIGGSFSVSAGRVGQNRWSFYRWVTLLSKGGCVRMSAKVTE